MGSTVKRISALLFLIVCSNCSIIFEGEEEAELDDPQTDRNLRVKEQGEKLDDKESGQIEEEDETPPLVIPCDLSNGGDFATIFEDNNHCYKYFKQTLSWDAAESNCQLRGNTLSDSLLTPNNIRGHLVSITSPAEYNFVRNTIALEPEGDIYFSTFWLGLNDKETEDLGTTTVNFKYTNDDQLPLASTIDETVSNPWKDVWHKWDRSSNQANGAQPNNLDLNGDSYDEDCSYQRSSNGLWYDYDCNITRANPESETHRTYYICEFENSL